MKTPEQKGLKQEIERIKMLYRPIIDLDTAWKTPVPPNYSAADSALDALLTSYQEELVKKIEAILTPNEALDDAEEPHRSFLAIQNIGIKNALALIKDTKI